MFLIFCNTFLLVISSIRCAFVNCSVKHHSHVELGVSKRLASLQISTSFHTVMIFTGTWGSMLLCCLGPESQWGALNWDEWGCYKDDEYGPDWGSCQHTDSDWGTYHYLAYAADMSFESAWGWENLLIVSWQLFLSSGDNQSQNRFKRFHVINWSWVINWVHGVSV